MSNGRRGRAAVQHDRAPGFLTFGQDPNDLTNATGRLPNDRPHVFRATGVVASAVGRHPGRGEPAALQRQALGGDDAGAAAAGQPAILLEPRGTRRLSSQTLLDLRVSKTLRFGGAGKVDLMLDVLNVLNDSAEEALVSDNWFAPRSARRGCSSIRGARCLACG